MATNHHSLTNKMDYGMSGNRHFLSLATEVEEFFVTIGSLLLKTEFPL